MTKLHDRIVWQGEYANYDDHGVSDLFSDPIEAYKAIGFLEADSTPKLRVDHSWSVIPRRIFASHEAAKNDEQNYDPKTFTTYYDNLQLQAYLECYYLPCLIRKYEEGKHLNKDERLALGIEP